MQDFSMVDWPNIIRGHRQQSYRFSFGGKKLDLVSNAVCIGMDDGSDISSFKAGFIYIMVEYNQIQFVQPYRFAPYQIQFGIAVTKRG
jgi:hypothetical protein